jgi:hypothetical protein
MKKKIYFNLKNVLKPLHDKIRENSERNGPLLSFEEGKAARTFGLQTKTV